MAKAKPDDGGPCTPKTKVIKLLSSKRSVNTEIRELAGGFGSEIKDAVENHHLNRKAFNMAAQFDKMEAEQARDVWDAFEHYMEVGGMFKKIDSVQPMHLRPKDEEEENEPEPEGRKGATVKEFPSPRSQAAE